MKPLSRNAAVARSSCPAGAGAANVSSGAPGVVLFLLDLAAATGHEAYLEDAARCGVAGGHLTAGGRPDAAPRADWHDDRRGRYRTSYEDSKQHERLLGTGVQRLPATHPGAAHRRR
ncbi:hypothetical protein [Nonomuraea sp. CA-141351]|uniref:hypothetical protein n=1 Tax=Nonomuraea sp. CA-141351 TaxID=3239996 RepID=UPI003D914852